MVEQAIELLDKQGTVFALASEMASGGEGSIHTVAGQAEWVVKYYHAAKSERRKKDALRKQEAKIAYMVGHKPFMESFEGDPPHDYWTWPSAELFNEAGEFSAYLMPKVDAIKGEEFLQFSSGFNWQQRLQACMDLARVVEATHEAGYIIGDLNPRNLFFTAVDVGESSELIFPTVTDSDSFQVNDLSTGEVLFACTVQNPEYSAPELINAFTFERSVEQDYFTLAIVIFQLMSLGVHPFSGTVKGLANQEIKNNIAKGRNVLFSEELKAPKFMMDLAILPKEIHDLFDKTFRLGHTITKARATSSEWQAVLSDLLSSHLLRCHLVESHVFSDHLSECPWCSYAEAQGDPFNPALKTFNELNRKKKASAPKLMDTPNLPTGSDFIQATQKTDSAIRAEIGDNTFFGPIPDDLMPGYEETQKPKAKTKAKAKAKAPQKKQKKQKKRSSVKASSIILTLLLVCFLGAVAWLVFLPSGQNFYQTRMQPSFNTLLNRTDSKPENSSTDQELEPLTPETTPLVSDASTAELSLRVEACIDADNQAPYDCVAANQAFEGISLSVQDARSTISLESTQEPTKESYLATNLVSGRYNIIMDDRKVLTNYSRCPSTNPHLNPASNPYRLELRTNTTILFVYCQGTN